MVGEVPEATFLAFVNFNYLYASIWSVGDRTKIAANNSIGSPHGAGLLRNLAMTALSVSGLGFGLGPILASTGHKRC